MSGQLSLSNVKTPSKQDDHAKQKAVPKSNNQRLVRNGELLEPEPDYDWDSPDHSEASQSVSKSSETKKMSISDTSDHEDAKSAKKAVSLADIIVQSMSASNSNKSSLSSSSSKFANSKRAVERIAMPAIAQSATSTLEHAAPSAEGDAEKAKSSANSGPKSPVTVRAIPRDSYRGSENAYSSLEGESRDR